MAKYFFVLILLIPIRPPEQSRDAPTKVKTPSAEKIHTVPFCELVKDPARYDGQIVRTVALYRFGGEELSELYSPACQKEESLEGRAAVYHDDLYETLTKRSILKIVSPGSSPDGIVLVVLV